MFHTTSSGQALSLPVYHLFLRANGPSAWFGWPQDDEIERLRAAWVETGDPAESKHIADQLNARAMELMYYIPLGFYWQPSVWRKNPHRRVPRPGDGVLEHRQKLTRRPPHGALHAPVRAGTPCAPQ